MRQVGDNVRDRAAVQRAELAALVESPDPESVPLGDAVTTWEAFDRIERLAASAKTLLAHRVDQSREWARCGFRRPEEFLAHRGGVAVGEARRCLDASKQLRDLAHTRAAARRGELSAPQLNAVTAAATDNPRAEADLLRRANQATLDELRRACRQARAAACPDLAERERRIHAQRHCRTWVDGEGTWRLAAQGTAADGARIEQALRIGIDQRYPSGMPREPREAYAFDSLAGLADHALGKHHARPSGATPRPSRNGEPQLPVRYLALLRIDVAALQRGCVQGQEVCEIAGVGTVPVERARELLGEAALRLIITRGADVANVTAAGRGWSAAQRIAVLWTRRSCSVSGCNRPWVDIDHRHEWAQGGTTSLGNADLYCRYHHDQKTHHGWALVPGTGKRPMVPPDDPRHPQHRPPPDTS